MAALDELGLWLPWSLARRKAVRRVQTLDDQLAEKVVHVARFTGSTSATNDFLDFVEEGCKKTIDVVHNTAVMTKSGADTREAISYFRGCPKYAEEIADMMDEWTIVKNSERRFKDLVSGYRMLNDEWSESIFVTVAGDVTDMFIAGYKLSDVKMFIGAVDLMQELIAGSPACFEYFLWGIRHIISNSPESLPYFQENIVDFSPLLAATFCSELQSCYHDLDHFIRLLGNEDFKELAASSSTTITKTRSIPKEKRERFFKLLRKYDAVAPFANYLSSVAGREYFGELLNLLDTYTDRPQVALDIAGCIDMLKHPNCAEAVIRNCENESFRERDDNICQDVLEAAKVVGLNAEIIDAVFSDNYAGLLERSGPREIVVQMCYLDELMKKNQPQAIKQLIDLWSDYESKAAVELGDYVNQFAGVAPELTSGFINLVGRFDPSYGVQVAWRLTGLTDTVGNLAGELIDMFAAYEKEPAKALDLARKLENLSCRDRWVKRYAIEIYTLLAPGKFSESVYHEFNDYIETETSERVVWFKRSMKREEEFISRQQDQDAFPMAVILYRNLDYIPKIKEFAQRPMFTRNLTQAWDIARKGDFPMDEFYSTFQRALDIGTADRWAKEIVDGFHTQGEAGLLREVVG